MFAQASDGRWLGSQDSNLDLTPPKGVVLPLHHSPVKRDRAADRSPRRSSDELSGRGSAEPGAGWTSLLRVRELPEAVGGGVGATEFGQVTPDAGVVDEVGVAFTELDRARPVHVEGSLDG